MACPNSAWGGQVCLEQVWLELGDHRQPDGPEGERTGVDLTGSAVVVPGIGKSGSRRQ
jgi:hypothetical protein